MKWTHVVGFLLLALVMFVGGFFGRDAEGNSNGIGEFFMFGSIVVGVFTILIFSQQHRWSKEKADRLRKVSAEYAGEVAKVNNIVSSYREKYEQRKQSIGTIECPQCKWTGQWGTGMTYEEFFLYDLTVIHGLDVSLSVHTPSNLSDEAQYKCPQCKSINWQKV